MMHCVALQNPCGDLCYDEIFFFFFFFLVIFLFNFGGGLQGQRVAMKGTEDEGIKMHDMKEKTI